MKYKRLGITLRTALLSWLVTLATLSLFVTVIIPEQKQTFIENLRSKAYGVTVSLRDVVAGSIVNEDFSSVVDHCTQMLTGDKSIAYLVITRNDGFSLIHDHQGWRVETEMSTAWRPEKREAVSGIGTTPFLNRRVFYYSQPFDYSGIQWGWIHVGLTLDSYDRSVTAVYGRTGMLAVLCILFSLAASFIYARRMVKPILTLQTAVQRVTGGDFSARAPVQSNDEVGCLAASFNTMTDTLLQRDKILESVRFAAQRFLSNTDWQKVLREVLGKLGEAADVSSICMFENHFNKREGLLASLRYAWVGPGVPPEMTSPIWRQFSVNDYGFGSWTGPLDKGEIVVLQTSELEGPVKDIVSGEGIKSFIVIPIRVENQWWGILTLNENRYERQWSEAEQDSIRAAADMLGAAIERQRMEVALLQAKEAAEKASRAKSEFLATMSHELRTPLHQIMGFTELVVNGLPDTVSDKQRRYLSLSLQSSEHLLSLINDILDIAKIEAGKTKLSLNEVDLLSFLEESLLMVREKAPKNNIEISLKVEGIPERIVADDRMLKQVLYNLLSNAAKFTGEGGTIELAAAGFAQVHGHLLTGDGRRIVMPQQARCGMGDGTEFVEVTVTDTGVGLLAEDLDRIFDPFEQVDSSLARKFEGTGLGLALSKEFVELHGGRIWAESQGLDKGSTFRFIIPVRQTLEVDTDASGRCDEIGKDEKCDRK
jgi:signal transduction histidine kinase